MSLIESNDWLSYVSGCSIDEIQKRVINNLYLFFTVIIQEKKQEELRGLIFQC